MLGIPPSERSGRVPHVVRTTDWIGWSALHPVLAAGVLGQGIKRDARGPRHDRIRKSSRAYGRRSAACESPFPRDPRADRFIWREHPLTLDTKKPALFPRSFCAAASSADRPRMSNADATPTNACSAQRNRQCAHVGLRTCGSTTCATPGRAGTGRDAAESADGVGGLGEVRARSPVCSSCA
jgi:hypothetical protein